MTKPGEDGKIDSMKMDLYPMETWDRTNTLLAETWGELAGQTLQAHGGVAQALNDVVLGFAQIYSHKRSVAVVRGNSWVIDRVTPWFLKEAYQVQSIDWMELEKDPVAWVATLKKDTAFVLFAEDNPATAETWKWQALEYALQEKKLFSIRVSHQNFISDSSPVAATSCRVCSVAPDFSVILTGERFRTSLEGAPLRPWDAPSCLATLKASLSSPFDAKSVEAFESQFAQYRFFPAGQPRHYDRALLSFEGIGADALVERLNLRLGSRDGLEALQLCRWGSVRLYDGWWKPAPSPEKLRGALAISVSRLKTKDFAKILQESYEELQTQQSW